jgi:hypothetical protein
LKLRPLGYEDREAPFNPQQHPVRTTEMLRQPDRDQAGTARCLPGLFDGEQPDGPR